MKKSSLDSKHRFFLKCLRFHETAGFRGLKGWQKEEYLTTLLEVIHVLKPYFDEHTTILKVLDRLGILSEILIFKISSLIEPLNNLIFLLLHALLKVRALIFAFFSFIWFGLEFLRNNLFRKLAYKRIIFLKLFCWLIFCLKQSINVFFTHIFKDFLSMRTNLNNWTRFNFFLDIGPVSPIKL